LHHFRIAAKSLHYALELPVGPEPATWMEDAKAVQKIVGEIHDCEAVRTLIAGMPGHEHAAKSLRNRQRKKRSQFRELWHERLASRSPEEVVISRRPPVAATQP
jgi:CHAD domain-containing protein